MGARRPRSPPSPRSATPSTSSWSPRSRGPRTSTTSTGCSPSSRPRPASTARSSSTPSSRPPAASPTSRRSAPPRRACRASRSGPADLAANRRMKTTRVGGGHPGYLVRADPDADDPDAPRPTYQQDLWHYTIARMVDACVTYGVLPYYGPFGDIADTTACEDQFRNAYLLGCVGAWSLHPAQVDDRQAGLQPAARGRRPRPPGHRGDGRRHRRRAARREDGGRRLGQAVQGRRGPGRAARRPRPRAGRRRTGSRHDRRAAARAARCSTCRRRTPRRWRRPRRSRATRIIFDLEDAVAPDAKPAAREQAVAAVDVRRVRPPRADDPLQRPGHAVGRRRPRRRRRGRGRRPSSSRRSTRRPSSTRSPPASTPPAAPDTMIWAMVETPTAIFDVRAIAAHPRVAVLVMGTNDLAKEIRAPLVPGPGQPDAVPGDRRARGPGGRQGHPRRRLQRRRRRRGLRRRVPPGRRDGLRRQDARPPQPGRAGQRGVVADGRRGRAARAGSSPPTRRPRPRAAA